MTQPEPGQSHLVDRGPVVEATPDHQVSAAERFDARLELARKGGDHLWVAIAYYTIDPTAQPFHLDLENLAGPPMIGCFRCEVAFEPRQLRRRCKGDTP